MRPARWAAAAISLAACLTACTSAPVSATPAPGPSVLEPATLAGYYAQRLDWQPCDAGF